MANVNKNSRKNVKAFWKFVNGSVKSSKTRIESLNNKQWQQFSSHAGKVKILKSHYEKLGSELDM